MVHLYCNPLTHQQARAKDGEDDDDSSDDNNMSDDEYVSDADEEVDCCYVCYEVKWKINLLTLTIMRITS
jgi:hypothetical protein